MHDEWLMKNETDGLDARRIKLERSRRHSVFSPHAPRDVALFRTDRLQVDRRRFHSRMTKPPLDEIERHAGAHGVKPETVPQAFWRRMNTGTDASLPHDHLHQLPCAGARPMPKFALWR